MSEEGKVSVSAKWLKASAAEKPGPGNFDKIPSDEAINAWVTELTHMGLNAFGRSAVSSLVGGDRVRRLHVAD